MNRFIKILFTVLVAVWIVIGLVHVSSADLPSSDIAEINQYKLNEKTLAQFVQATNNLVPIVQKARRADSEDSDDSEEPESLSKLVEAVDAIPGAQKAIHDAGMTTRDYLKFQIALVYAASGQIIKKSGGKLPDEYSKENVEFFSAHESELKKHQNDFDIIRNFTKEDERDDDDDEEDN